VRAYLPSLEGRGLRGGCLNWQVTPTLPSPVKGEGKNEGPINPLLVTLFNSLH